MEAFRFIKFPVYRDSKLFYKDCCALSGTFPREHWSLQDQLRRAALSVCLNVAEGSAKYSDKDFHRFLEISLGSMNECIACLDIAKDNNLISDHDFDNMHEKALNISKQLGGLCKTVRGSIRK